MTMSVEKVREYLMPYGVADRMREFEVSSATVELAALAVGVEGARIAKTLSFKVGGGPHPHRGRRRRQGGQQQV